MKKIFLTLAAMFIAVNVFAQTEQNEETRMQKEILKTFHSRNMANKPLKKNVPVATAPATKGNTMKTLPEDRVWFPGEWEEVQAIAVTPLYSYKVPSHESSMYWYADPLVSG